MMKVMNKINGKNKKKIGIILLAFAIFAMLVLGVLMYKSSAGKGLLNTSPSPTLTPAETINPSAIVSAVACKTPDTDSTLYKNTTYGFSLNLPSAWGDRVINETAGKTAGVVDQVEFQLVDVGIKNHHQMDD